MDNTVSGIIQTKYTHGTSILESFFMQHITVTHVCPVSFTSTEPSFLDGNMDVLYGIYRS
jgi:hypothetical protein